MNKDYTNKSGKAAVKKAINDKIETATTDKSRKIRQHKTAVKQKMQPKKPLQKWIEYTHLWKAKGLSNRQMHAVKLFITQEVKSISDWARKTGISKQTLSRWFHHDELFQQCLSNASDIYLNVIIPFGIMRLAKRIKQGDIRALNFWLKLIGGPKADRHKPTLSKAEEILEEWVED